MKELIIDRAIWLHGEGNDKSYLLREADQKMCCLGFFCDQQGRLPVEKFMGKRTLSNVFNIRDGWRILDMDTKTQYFLMRVNDEKGLEDDFREAAIIYGFEQAGIVVQFRGQYPT
jgi:hypothetical protein